jgi:hypothetical protein
MVVPPATGWLHGSHFATSRVAELCDPVHRVVKCRFGY